MSFTSTNPFANRVEAWPFLWRQFGSDASLTELFNYTNYPVGWPYFQLPDDDFAKLAEFCWRPALGQAGFLVTMSGAKFHYVRYVHDDPEIVLDVGSLTFKQDAESSDFDDTEPFVDFTKDGNQFAGIIFTEHASEQTWSVTVQTALLTGPPANGLITFSFRATITGRIAWHGSPASAAGAVVIAETHIVLRYVCFASDPPGWHGDWGSGEGEAEWGGSMYHEWHSNIKEPYYHSTTTDEDEITFGKIGAAEDEADFTAEGQFLIGLHLTDSTTPTKTIEGPQPLYRTDAERTEATLLSANLVLNKLHASPP